MDFLGELFGRFKRVIKPKELKEPKTISQSLEGKFTPRVWTSEYFREYLVAIGRGDNYLLRIDQYPDLIELGESWHQVLENMRVKTGSTGNEHYSVVGVSDHQRKVVLQSEALKGEKGQVSPGILKQANSIANRAGFNNVGDVHTHPNSHDLSFSLADLYGLVHSKSRINMRVILGKSDNLVVFKTQNSITTGLPPEVLSLDGFCRTWYENSGYRYVGSSENGEMAVPNSLNPSSQWEINLKVAKRHGLVLYECESNGDLVKVFPVKSNTS